MIRWVPDTECQKRERLDNNEEDLLPLKRRALQEQISPLEMQTQNNPLNLGGSDATKVPSHVIMSEVSLVDIASDKDEVPELTYSNSTPSSDKGDFRSIDDFAIDDSGRQTELPDLFELINKPSIGPKDYQAQSLDEETIFSQYLRSPSPVYPDTPAISNDVEDSVKPPPQFINLADVRLPPEDHYSNESLSRDGVSSRENQKSSSKPRITLRINPPKPLNKPKLMLKLSQPKKNRA